MRLFRSPDSRSHTSSAPVDSALHRRSARPAQFGYRPARPDPPGSAQFCSRRLTRPAQLRFSARPRPAAPRSGARPAPHGSAQLNRLRASLLNPPGLRPAPLGLRPATSTGSATLRSARLTSANCGPQLHRLHRLRLVHPAPPTCLGSTGSVRPGGTRLRYTAWAPPGPTGSAQLPRLRPTRLRQLHHLSSASSAGPPAPPARLRQLRRLSSASCTAWAPPSSPSSAQPGSASFTAWAPPSSTGSAQHYWLRPAPTGSAPLGSTVSASSAPPAPLRPAPTGPPAPPAGHRPAPLAPPSSTGPAPLSSTGSAQLHRLSSTGSAPPAPSSSAPPSSTGSARLHSASSAPPSSASSTPPAPFRPAPLQTTEAPQPANKTPRPPPPGDPTDIPHHSQGGPPVSSVVGFSDRTCSGGHQFASCPHVDAAGDKLWTDGSPGSPSRSVRLTVASCPVGVAGSG
jgi:hypothetical protein